jgi:hypothetical protein
MLILAHVFVAFASVAWVTHLYLHPSRRRLHAAYGLIAVTLMSGTYLVVSTGSPLLSSCVTGIMYLGLVSIGLYASARRLSSDR